MILQANAFGEMLTASGYSLVNETPYFSLRSVPAQTVEVFGVATLRDSGDQVEVAVRISHHRLGIKNPIELLGSHEA
jgi:hypothetical protein